MWIEVRNLYDAITRFHEFDNDEKCGLLLKRVDRYKTKLANLLCNTSKSTADRARLVPNAKLTIGEVEIKLDAQLCSEALIISEIFNINELEAVELVLAGEAQKVHFDGINRGLIAVVCYYDSHRLLISTLRQILKWDREDLPTNLLHLIDENFVQEIVIKNLFRLLNTFTVQSEFARLMQPNVNGLGGSKHQKLLRNAIEEIRNEILTCISLICEYPGVEAVTISSYLFSVVKNVPAEKLNLSNLTAWLALVKLTSSEVLNQVQDASIVLTQMIEHIRNETAWSDQAMCGTIQLACAVSLRALAASPADHLGIENIKVDVDRVIDRAVRNMAFQYMRQAIIRSDHFKFSYQFYVADELLKQLVAYFPAKLMECERNSADELAWLDEQHRVNDTTTGSTTGKGQSTDVQYDAAASHYENFLRCFVDLYEMQNDVDCEKNTISFKERELMEQIEESSMSFSTERSIELCRLLERARLPHHVVHSVAYLDMASAICKNNMTATFLFDIFGREQPGAEVYGWETLMTALRSYDRLFREQRSNNRTLNQSQMNQSMRQVDKVVVPAQELSGLVSWLRVAAKVAHHDNNAALRFAEDQSWGALGSLASIASSPVPSTLKASLINLLTSIGRIKTASNRVWQVLSYHQLCYFTENGVLMGMQQELDERECASKQYDVSLSFVKLISTLLTHRTMPDFAAPYIQFVTRSILAQFASRSYNDVSQMWSLAENALRATNSLLESGIVEPRALAANEVHIALLTQCLNDTPLFRSITKIIMEDCQAQADPYASRHSPSSDSALIALKIISRAIVLHSAIRACARVSSSDIMVASIQSLVFTPIHASSPCTLLDLVFHYLQMADEYPHHALFSARILRDVISVRGQVMGTMLELLRSRDLVGAHVRAIRTALCVTSIHYTVEDSLSKDEDTENASYARGETARIILETLSDAIDSFENGGKGNTADTNNICYYLLAFRPSKAHTKELYDNDDILTGLHFVLFVIEQFIAAQDPFSLPFSALLEPSFRLMQRLVSLSCPFSMPVLCFMRSSNVIEKLVTSPFVCTALEEEDEVEDNYTTGLFSIRRMIAGYILHFAAVEISAMLTSGHFSRPERLYRALLESSEEPPEQSDDGSDEEIGANLLFSLLRRATITKKTDLIYPELVHFDVNKLHELFDACLSVTIYGVAQYDIEYLDRLLRREVEAVYTECDEVRYVQKEMENVLEYCTEVNANLLSESASERVVSGCTALLNVFAVFAPVHFFSSKMQLIIFRDACYVLIEMMSGVGGATLLQACSTFHRMTQTVCRLAKEEFVDIVELRQFVSSLFKSLIELLLQPGEKGIDAKISLYKTLRFILRTVFEKDSTATVQDAEEWLLDGYKLQPSSSYDTIIDVVDEMADDIARHLATNIADIPSHRKAAVVILTNDLLHEDMKSSNKLSTHLSKSGVPRVLCEDLLAIDFDWNIVGSSSSTSATILRNEHISKYQLLTSIMTTFTRLIVSDDGWNALSELGVTEIFTEMPVFAEPPKDVFLKPHTVKSKGSPANLYASTLDLALHVCKQLCTKTKWRKISLKVLAFIQSLGEVFQQLMRAEVDCDCLNTARAIVYEISINDESIIGAIDGDNVLRQLKNSAGQNPSAHSKINVNTSFAAPKQLFSTLLPV